MAASAKITKYAVLQQYENFNCTSSNIFSVLALTQIHEHGLKALLLKGKIYQNQNQRRSLLS